MSQQQPDWTSPGQPPRPTNINDFTPPRTSLPLIVVAVAVGAALLVVLLMLTQRPSGQLAPTATPTPTQATAQPSWGLPFMTEDESCTGRWEITGQNWRGNGLEIEVRLGSDQCSLDLSFSAVTSAEALSYEPVVDGEFLEYGGVHLQPGQERSGSIFFPMPREPSIIMMADGDYNQLSALEVVG
ncbi:MAG: hypothetical protein LBI99_09640 [Propionibacteriaceae bacterium]|jgi:hypothetical protein|nr:hypothetical protein [Propionibacteriaceae bacterium]